jgi:hypothetical protein
MAASTDPTSNGIVRRELSVYDLLLGAIPVPPLLGATAGVAAGVGVPYGVGVGSLGAAALVVYALFVASPTDDADRAGRAAPADD